MISVFLNQVSATQQSTENESSESLKCGMENIKLLQRALTRYVLSACVAIKRRFLHITRSLLGQELLLVCHKHENNEPLRKIAEKVLHGMTVNVAVYGGIASSHQRLGHV